MKKLILCFVLLFSPLVFASPSQTSCQAGNLSIFNSTSSPWTIQYAGDANSYTPPIIDNILTPGQTATYRFCGNDSVKIIAASNDNTDSCSFDFLSLNPYDGFMNSVAITTCSAKMIVPDPVVPTQPGSRQLELILKDAQN